MIRSNSDRKRYSLNDYKYEKKESEGLTNEKHTNELCRD